MDAQEKAWKDQTETLLSAPGFDYAQAARLAATIAGAARDQALALAAKQVLPCLKAAADRRADAFSRSVARRRFGLVRDALHALAQPRFGRRAFRPAGGPTRSAADAELFGRRTLGLPEHGELAAPAILAAFKRAAKAAHPDLGGSTEAFATVMAARDSLLKR